MTSVNLSAHLELIAVFSFKIISLIEIFTDSVKFSIGTSEQVRGSHRVGPTEGSESESG